MQYFLRTKQTGPNQDAQNWNSSTTQTGTVLGGELPKLEVLHHTNSKCPFNSFSLLLFLQPSHVQTAHYTAHHTCVRLTTIQLTTVSPVEWHLGFPWQRFSSASLLWWQSEGHSLSADEALHHWTCKCNRFYRYIKHCEYICYGYAPRMSTSLPAHFYFSLCIFFATYTECSWLQM